MSGYIGTKVVTLSTTSASVGGDSTVGGDLTVDTNTLYVDSTNNRVGVGTDSPSAIATIKTASNEEDVILIEQSDGTDVGSLRINNGAFIIKGKNASQPIQLQTHDGNEDIEVDPDGFIKMETAGSERLRIDVSGNLLVGKTSTAFNTAGSGILSTGEGQFVRDGGHPVSINRKTSDGNVIYFAKDATQVGSISVTGSSTAYNTSSDYRLKENVTNVTDGITRVKQLEPKRFNFITNPDKTVDGFLAHEAQSVVPEAVTGTHNEVDDDGNAIMQGIDQSKLVPLLTAALKESITKIETLETEMTSVKARLDALEGN
jgi:hypothetical protein